MKIDALEMRFQRVFVAAYVAAWVVLLVALFSFGSDWPTWVKWAAGFALAVVAPDLHSIVRSIRGRTVGAASAATAPARETDRG